MNVSKSPSSMRKNTFVFLLLVQYPAIKKKSQLKRATVLSDAIHLELYSD